MRSVQTPTERDGSYGDVCVAFNASHFALHHVLGVGMMFVMRFEHLDRAIEPGKLCLGYRYRDPYLLFSKPMGV